MPPASLSLPTLAIVKTASYAFNGGGIYSNDKTSIIAAYDLCLLSILNSRVADHVMHSIASTKQGGYFEYNPMYVGHLPIRPINHNNPSGMALHDEIVRLVDLMLSLHRELQGVTLPDRQEQIRNRIEYTDRKIDEPV